MTVYEIIADLMERTNNVVAERVAITLNSDGMVDFTIDDAVDAVEAGLPEDYPAITSTRMSSGVPQSFATRRDLIADMAEQIIAEMVGGGDAG